MTGTVLGDRYELLELVGQGGMALVYKARCRLLNRIVAIKILKEEYSKDGNFIEKFNKEAMAAASLSHPNIVNIYDVGQQDETYYIVMEYIEGKTLKQIISAEGQLPVNRAIDIAIMICDGLHHAHEKGVIHLDIKPHNIIITETGIVKVADFGISKAISSKTVTFGGNVMGSVYYISPEQARGEPVTRATDIYSVGCVLYEMVTGKTPFDAESPITIALKHIHDEPVPPHLLNNLVKPQLEDIILKAMRKVPAQRYTTSEEMRNAILSLGNNHTMSYSGNKNQGYHEETIIMPPVGSEGKGRKVRKRKLRTTNIIALLLVIIGLLTGFIYTNHSFFGSETTVPRVVGLTTKEANDKLDKAGLKMLQKGQQASSDVPADKVIWQKPLEGEKVKKGREIEVMISTGPDLQDVPNVVGLTYDEADLKLRNAGFEVGSTEKAYDDKFKENFIISQDPQAGSSVDKDSTISLMISKGPAPEKVAMPDLKGLSLDQATKKLDQNQLQVGEVKKESSQDYFTDQVIKQDTDPGVLIEQQSKVNLVISSGPGPSAQSRAVEFQLPTDKDYYKVIITVTDNRGQREVYNQQQKAGETVYVAVTYYGSGVANVTLNGKAYKSFKL